MAFYDLCWYCNAGNQSTTGYYAVPLRPQNTAVVAGQLCRQFTAPAVGSERVFICIVAGTTANTTDATWVLTRGNPTTDGTAKWMECTGASAVNGDLTNTPNWNTVKSQSVSVGVIIKRLNGASYQIATVSAVSSSGAEPAFSDVAGVTTADGAQVWYSLGPVSNFTGGQAPHARLANACATNWFAAGNTIYVGDNHAESQTTSITIQPTLGNPSVGRILCHNHSGNYPPASSDLTTGATISTTGTSASISINPSNGGMYFYGLTLKSGVGTSSAASNISIGFGANSWVYYDHCSFQISNTGSNALLTIGSAQTSPSIITLNNCTVGFNNVTQFINVAGAFNFLWQNTGQVLASGSLVPNNFMQPTANGQSHNIIFEALDLSQLTGNIWNPNSWYEACNITIKDCKLNALAAVQAPVFFGVNIQLIRSSA
jgi:hypothetical protein